MARTATVHGTAVFPRVAVTKSGDSFVQLGPAWVSVTPTNSFWGAVLICLLSQGDSWQWQLAVTDSYTPVGFP